MLQTLQARESCARGAETNTSRLVYTISGRRKPDAPWALEVNLAESRDDEWVFRRDAAITRHLGELGHVSADSIPYVAPEIVLLFKAKMPRAKDEHDFGAAVEHLEPQARAWLGQNLARVHPNHPWLGRLGDQA